MKPLKSYQTLRPSYWYKLSVGWQLMIYQKHGKPVCRYFWRAQ